MKFSDWVENKILNEKKAQPVQMPKKQSNIIKLSEPSPQRMAGGRKNTSFDPKKNKGTKGEKNRKAINDSWN